MNRLSMAQQGMCDSTGDGGGSSSLRVRGTVQRISPAPGFLIKPNLVFFFFSAMGSTPCCPERQRTRAGCSHCSWWIGTQTFGCCCLSPHFTLTHRHSDSAINWASSLKLCDSIISSVNTFNSSTKFTGLLEGEMCSHIYTTQHVGNYCYNFFM